MKAKLINNKHSLFKFGIITIIVVVCLGLYNTIDQILKHTSIDRVSAENFACSDANFQSEDVLVLSNDFVKENGKYVYKISFVNNNNQYDYVINGKDGSVIEKNQSISNIVYNRQKNNFDKKISIDIEEAKKIVSDYYNIKSKDNLIYTKAKLDDEKRLVYSIIMNDNEKEYNAEVSAANGTVISSQVIEKETKQNNTAISRPVSTSTKTNDINNQDSNKEAVNDNSNTNNIGITTTNNDSENQAVIIPTPTEPVPTTDTNQNQIQIDNDDDNDDDKDDDDDDDKDDDDDDDKDDDD